LEIAEKSQALQQQDSGSAPAAGGGGEKQLLLLSATSLQSVAGDSSKNASFAVHLRGIEV